MIFRNISLISRTPGFTYKGAYYPTHDNLIGRYQGADGIKTGYTGASGFNLASSVVRDGVHLIGVVMGGRTRRRGPRNDAVARRHLRPDRPQPQSWSPAPLCRGRPSPRTHGHAP